MGILAEATGTAVEVRLAVVEGQSDCPFLSDCLGPVGLWSLPPTQEQQDSGSRRENVAKSGAHFLHSQHGSTVLEVTASSQSENDILQCDSFCV